MAEWCDFDESKEVMHARRGQTWHLATRESNELRALSAINVHLSNPDKKLVGSPKKYPQN